MPVLGEFKAVVSAVLDQSSIETARRGLVQGFKNTGAGQSGVEAAKAAGSWSQFGKSVASVPGNLRVLYHTGGLGKAVNELKEARRATDEFGGALREFVPATAALTGLGSVAGFGEMLRQFAEHGTQVRNIAGPLGVATQDLERWDLSAQRAGVATGAVAKAFGQFNDKIHGAAYGTDTDAVGTFGQFHIAAKKADGSARQLIGVLPEVFAAFKENARDPWIQHNLLKHFGLEDIDPLFRKVRDFNELLQELNKSSAHGILSDEAEARAAALYGGFTDLGQSVTGFAHALSADLAPTFGPLLKGMSDWLDKNRENRDLMGQVMLGVEGVAAVFGVALVRGLGLGALALLRFIGPFGRVLAIATALESLGIFTPPIPSQLSPEDQQKEDEKRRREIEQTRRGQVGRARHWWNPLDWLSGSAAGVPSGSSAMPSYNPKAGNSEAMIRGAIAAAGGNAMAQAGLLSNFDYESGGLNPRAKNPGSGATGWAQWISSTRPRPLSSFGDPLDPQTQAKMLNWELSGPYKSVIERMNQAKTPEEAAEIGLRHYEGVNESNSEKAGAPWGKMLATHTAKARGYLEGGAANVSDYRPVVAGLTGALSARDNSYYRGIPVPGTPYSLPKTDADVFSGGSFTMLDVAGAKAADSHHQVDFNITGAPAGARADVSKSTGPADFNLRVEHAMATP